MIVLEDGETWEDRIAYLVAVRQHEGRLMVARWNAMRYMYRVCQKGCGEYYNPDWGHTCE